MQTERATKPRTGCPECKKLKREIAKLKARLGELEGLLATAMKNSATSSKPASSDITNPPKRPPREGSPRKRGGQPGHPRHERPPFTTDQINQTWIYYYDACPCCGGQLRATQVPDKVRQQVEIKSLPIQVEEHRRITQEGAHCQKTFSAPWPDELVKAGLVGPNLTALIGYMKSACHMSFSGMRKFLRDCVGFTISRGQLRKLVGKVTDSLQDPYEELLAMLSREQRLNVDETGHKENGRRLWTWCFRGSAHGSVSSALILRRAKAVFDVSLTSPR